MKSAAITPFGGIDLIQDNFQIDAGETTIPMIIPQGDMDPKNFQFDGFTPVVSQFAPVTNLALLSGIAGQTDPMQAVQIESVGRELEIKPLLAADTNPASLFPTVIVLMANWRSCRDVHLV